MGSTSKRQSLARVSPWLLALAFAGTACGPTTVGGNDGDGGGVGPDGSGQGRALVSIIVNPNNSIVEMDLGVGATQAFTATGNYSDNTTGDLTAQVTWTVDNSAVGVMQGPVLEVPAFAAAGAEVSKITAGFESMSGDGQITVLAYQQSGPEQDFFFVLPHQDPAGNQDKPLAFGTDVPAADVFFLMDTTGSMRGEIQNLQSALVTTVVPGIQAQIADTQFGAGAAEDFPVSPYGSTNCTNTGGGVDQPFELLQGITNDIPSVLAAVNALSNATGNPIGCGGDGPESNIEALYQVATGEGLAGPGVTAVPANTTGVGGVGFRAGTMPIIVQVTDILSHAPDEATLCTSSPHAYGGAVAMASHSRQQTKDALDSICARVVGIAPSSSGQTPECTGQNDLEDFSTSTESRVPPQAWDVGGRPAGCAAGQCCTDLNGTGRAPDGDGQCPLVYRVDANGSGLGEHTVTGINMLTRFAVFGVTTEKAGEAASTSGAPLPSGATTADFIKSITPVSFTVPPAPPTVPDPTFDATQFDNVTPGTIVAFDVEAFNDFVPATPDAQIFRATIRVLADGCADLDEREVLVLVPPVPLDID